MMHMSYSQGVEDFNNPKVQVSRTLNLTESNHFEIAN